MTTNPDEKILADLSALSEQITLCQSMLASAGQVVGGDDANEALLSVIGFLEACSPRMVELIEAAAQGALKAETFEQCLQINDKLTNVLADVEKDPKDRQPLTPAATGGANSAGDSPTEQQSTDIDQGIKKLDILSAAGGDSDTTGGKTTGLDTEDVDPFAGGPDLLTPTPPTATDAFKISESMGSDEAAAKTANDDDDFDAFFKDRTK